jgi:hypothetical protein
MPVVVIMVVPSDPRKRPKKPATELMKIEKKRDPFITTIHLVLSLRACGAAYRKKKERIKSIFLSNQEKMLNKLLEAII